MLEHHAAELYQLMAPIVGAPWTRIVLHGDVRSDSYQFDFYFQRKARTPYEKCFDAAPLEKLLPVFGQMARICRGAQESLRRSNRESKREIPLWTGFTLVITPDERFAIHYEYSEELSIPGAEWQKTYLL